jgi:hypothetical protein
MQIHAMATRDLLDLSLLTLEHAVGSADTCENIDHAYISQLLAKDWGFYHTVQNNLELLHEYIREAPWVTPVWSTILQQRLLEIQRAVEVHPKSGNWKVRSRFAERLPWYKEVSDRESVL